MHWLESGMELFTVSDLLGHKDVKVTIIYLRSTFKVKSDALDAGGLNNKLSEVFRPNYSTNEEFWNHLGIASMKPLRGQELTSPETGFLAKYHNQKECIPININW